MAYQWLTNGYPMATPGPARLKATDRPGIDQGVMARSSSAQGLAGRRAAKPDVYYGLEALRQRCIKAVAAAQKPERHLLPRPDSPFSGVRNLKPCSLSDAI